MKITALTCTGDRKICLELLTKWIKNQTMKVDQWLVVDDGKEPFMPTMDCDYIYRTPQRDDPAQTLNTNLEYALPHVTGDIVLFMEDDEYYAPNYVETMVAKIQGHEAVGLCNSKYYNMMYKTFYVHNTRDHASLAQTGVVKEYLPTLKALLKGDPFIDIRIWAEIGGRDMSWKKAPFINKELDVNNGRGLLFDDGDKNCLYVGIKGMPGRKGIGAGHKGGGRVDPNHQTLRQWMPKDCEDYIRIGKGLSNRVI